MARSPVDSVAEEVARALRGLDVENVRKTYWEQDEAVHMEPWLPASILDCMVAEVDRVRSAVHRNYIPKHKKGGAVCSYTLVEQAPTILGLYRAPAFIRWPPSQGTSVDVYTWRRLLSQPTNPFVSTDARAT